MKPGTQPHGFTTVNADAYSTQQSVEILYVASPSDLQLMRADSVAENQLCYIWKYVRALNGSNVTLTCSIDGVSGAENMVELWRQPNSVFFNCLMNEPYN